MNAIRRLLSLMIVTAALQSSAAATLDLDPDGPASVARNIWSESPPNSAQARWVRQLESNTARSDWAAALRTARQLAPFAKEAQWTWRIAQAELYLFDLQPERAVRELEAVFRAIPVMKHSC